MQEKAVEQARPPLMGRGRVAIIGEADYPCCAEMDERMLDVTMDLVQNGPLPKRSGQQ